MQYFVDFFGKHFIQHSQSIDKKLIGKNQNRKNLNYQTGKVL